MKEIRIATKKSDGTKHKVAFLDFKNNTVRVYGAVTKTKGFTTYHAKGFTLPLVDVEIEKVEETVALAQELFLQNIKESDIAGVTGRKHKVVHLRKSKEEVVVAERDLKLVFESALRTIKEDPKNNSRLCMNLINILSAATAANRNDIVAEFSDCKNNSGCLIDAIENAYCIL